MRINTEIDRITDEIKETVLRLFAHSLKNVILYGSYARGDNDDESDVDIFVLVDMSAGELSKYNDEVLKMASRLSLETKRCATISISLQDLATYNKYREYLPYFKNINKEGVVIYAA